MERATSTVVLAAPVLAAVLTHAHWGVLLGLGVWSFASLAFVWSERRPTDAG